MPRSMTGFGAADGPVGSARLKVEIRTVNHRYLTPQFKLPADLQPLEPELRERLRSRLERGHVTVSATWVGAPAARGGVMVDAGRAAEIAEQLAALQRELGLAGAIDIGLVARLPGVITTTDAPSAEIDAGAVLATVDAALEGVVETREREGATLAAELAGRLAALERHLNGVDGRAPARVVAERDRLRRAVRELLDGRPVDETRLAQEIALLAERLDVTEEIVRLRSHLGAARDALGAGRAVGRELSFLGQEMLREINTIGSKASDAEITQAAIAMKGELERYREQVENVE